MSDTTTTYYSNTSTGVREMSDTIFEDVEGVIQNISPTDTPISSMIGKTKATSPLHEWLEDDLKSVTGSNAAIEGADATATARSAPSRLNNYCQIISDVFKVSGTLDASSTIGRKEESKYQLEKSLKYMANELEYTIINNTSASAGSASAGRTMKGLKGFITTNDGYYTSYSTANDFSEAKFMKMAQDCYDAGGKPNVLAVPPRQARVIADWDQNSRITVNTNASEKTLVMAVMVLETPFGRVKVVVDRHIGATTESTGVTSDHIFLIDPSMLKIAYLRPLKTTELAKAGDARKFQSLMEATLVCYNEKAHAEAEHVASPDA